MIRKLLWRNPEMQRISCEDYCCFKAQQDNVAANRIGVMKHGAPATRLDSVACSETM